MAACTVRRSRTSAGRGWWVALVLILAAVLVPATCVLWFMVQAVGNERLAVRQKLIDLYQAQLADTPERIEAWWADKQNALLTMPPEASPSATFARIVRSGHFDSAIMVDTAGQPAYPSAPFEPEAVDNDDWRHAQSLEFEAGDIEAALQTYRLLSQQTDDVTVQGRALLGEARCLAQLEQHEHAIRILTEELTKPRYRHVHDDQGRALSLNGLLLALNLVPNHASGTFEATAATLIARVNDYADAAPPASQRRFLMRAVQELTGKDDLFPTQEAEHLAAAYLQVASPLPPAPDRGPSPLAGFWQAVSPDGRAIGLIRRRRVITEIEAMLAAQLPAQGVRARLLGPTDDQPGAAPLLQLDAEVLAPGWEVIVQLDGPDPFAAAADQRITAYVVTGTLGIAAISLLGLLGAYFIRRQMTLARLRNDLIATVSHELKTPLASMRVLVDTLRDGRTQNERQTTEYLTLVARENERLSRLIDNFLAFSRMERNRHAFEEETLDVRDVIGTALESIGERLATAKCKLTTDVADDLAPMRGDRDALVTVLLNLLDNALKYTGPDKQITLRASRQAGRIHLAVTDNGVGIPRRALRRIFNRFYQADQRLARETGGCGLGLSIVQFIVNAHGGSIDVRSEVGRGSTFIVILPALGEH